MKCDEAREQLPEHLLGTLEPATDLEVRRHLRGCASCRQDMALLSEGVSTFALAAHEVEPPAELRDRVLGALEDEWAEEEEGEPAAARRSRWRFAARVALTAAALVILGGSVGVSVAMTRHMADLEAQMSESKAEARKYETFLGVLGGENVRVGSVKPATAAMVHGSVVVYDSKVGQSWVLALVQAPGLHGRAWLTLSSGSRMIKLRPMEFGQGGEASTFLVTSSNLKAFNHFTLAGADGRVLATGIVAD